MTHRILTRTAQVSANTPDVSTAFDFTGAAVSPLAFSFTSRSLVTGDTLAYYADNGTGQYERGLATWNDTAKTLTRTTIRESSTGSAIAWTAAPTVWSDGRQEEDGPTPHAASHNSGGADQIASKFGDVAGGDYSEFEADGTLRFYGDATIWQDVDFPIIIRTTGANIPTLTTLQGNVTAPQWSVNDFSVCEAQELIHAWKEGSEVQWHVHFVTNGLDATNRYVNFEVEWFWVNPNGTLSATVTSAGDLLIPANTATKTMLIRQVAVATFAGKIGGHVYARLRRIASTGAAPTNSPWCSMLQMHVECDTLGSRLTTSK